MRKVQKLLIGAFAFGVLLAGVGTGIALVEYSSLRYGGEKILGEENLVTKTLEFELPDGQKELILQDSYDRRRNCIVEVSEDSELPERLVQYEVTYNEKCVRPYLDFESLEISEDEEVAEDQEGAENQEVTEDQDTAAEDQDSVEGQDSAENQDSGIGTLRLGIEYFGNDFGMFMEHKDRILDELKQNTISTYQTNYVTKVVIKANPETMKVIKSDFF